MMYTGCPWCGSANIETGDTLAVRMVSHPTRIYYDVGLCVACGNYCLHDGHKDHPPQRTTLEALRRLQ